MMMTFFYLFLRFLCWIETHIASVPQKRCEIKSQIETLTYKMSGSHSSLISTRLIRTKKRDPAVLEAALNNASLSNNDVASMHEPVSPTKPIEATKVREEKDDANKPSGRHDGSEKVLSALPASHAMPDEEKSHAVEDAYDWKTEARPEQREPEGDWRLWLILAGRGFGKTRTGAETVHAWVESGRYKRIGLVGATESDIRHVMVEGCSGLLSVYPHDEAPRYEPSKRRIVWPNGAVAYLVSAERYEKLRGLQFDAIWVDELAKFRYPQETWDQVCLSLRLGQRPRVIVTTTPKATALIKRLAEQQSWSVVTRGSTYANRANLAPGFIEHIEQSCQNEKLMRQEIQGEIVDDVVGALWRHEILDHQRIHPSQVPEMVRVVVAVDPSVAHHEEGDETGIVVAGLGVDQKAYVLADLSGRYGTPGWAEQVLSAYVTFEADCIIAEENQGGALVEQVLRAIDPDVFYQKVHASRGKIARAEPVSTLYARGRVHHVGQNLKQLENQLCTYVPGVSTVSPDRLDALVWAISSLLLSQSRPKRARLWSINKPSHLGVVDEAASALEGVAHRVF